MPLNDDQKRMLLTNLARDKAENLRNEIARMASEAKSRERPDLSDEDRQRGEHALQRAMESAQRLVANLEKAMALASEMAQESKDDAEPLEE